MTVPAPSPEAQQAVAAFSAAGNDLDALAAAIDKASFLDGTPGEERQKLRGETVDAETYSRECAKVQHEQRQGQRLMPSSVTWKLARTKLKKLRIDDEKKTAAASAKSAADRSPHTKEVHYFPQSDLRSF